MLAVPSGIDQYPKIIYYWVIVVDLIKENTLKINSAKYTFIKKKEKVIATVGRVVPEIIGIEGSRFHIYIDGI